MTVEVSDKAAPGRPARGIAGHLSCWAALLLRPDRLCLSRCQPGTYCRATTCSGRTAAPRLFWANFPLRSFGVKIVAALNRGETIVVEDLLLNSISDEPETRATADSVDTRAILVAPFMRGQQLRSLVYLNSREPRAWTPGEIALLQEVAERSVRMAERTEAERALKELNATLEEH